MIKQWIAGLTVSTMLMTSTALACEREPRYENYRKGDVIDVTLSDEFTVIKLEDEEAILGIIGDSTAIEVSQPNRSNLPTTLLFKAREDNVSEYLRLSATSGIDYIFRMRSGECGDSGITLEYDREVTPSRDFESLANRDRKTLNGLMALHWMEDYQTPVPDGYREVTYNHRPEAERLMLEQGSVRIYLSRMWRGTDRNVVLYEVVNNGRTALTLDITGLGAPDPRLREALGDVRQISMLPTDQTLGPHPEFLSDLYSDVNPHTGILIMTTERN